MDSALSTFDLRVAGFTRIRFVPRYPLAASAPSIGLDSFDELNALSNPEPGTLVLMGVGVVGFITIRRRRMKRQAAATC